jgi:hypothetical protein
MWHIEAQVEDNSYAYASEIILACIKNITVISGAISGPRYFLYQKYYSRNVFADLIISME